MNPISPRDQNMLLIAGVILLYAIVALSYKNARANWTIARRQYDQQEKKYAEECALINARNDWSSRYSRMRELMPVFPPDHDVATYWQRVLNNAAAENNLTIPRQMTGKETEVGDVFELPVDCKEWEGSIESLVKFLYALNKAGAMLDVRQLSIRSTNRQGILKGSFTLTCAYMRGEDATMGTAANESLQKAVAEKPAETNTPAATHALSITNNSGKPVPKPVSKSSGTNKPPLSR